MERKTPGEGRKAPAFTGTTETGDKVRLSDFKGKPVVLYFYPKDDTPGCTIEAKDFRDFQQEFSNAGAIVLGVSPDGAESHCKFIAKYDLNFSLLADTEHEIAEKYGAWGEKKNYGKSYMGIIRSTFIIGSDGRIVKAWPNVKAEGHAKAVLAAVREMS